MSARAPFGIALTLGLLASQASAGTVCVNKTGSGGCQTSIQAAVNMAVATPPGIVTIRPGTYFETVATPNTAGGGDDLEIVGSGKTMTIIDSGPPTSAEGIVVGAAVGVKVANLTVRNSAGQGGIFASTGADDAVISGVAVIGAAGKFGINITGNGVQVLSSEVRGCQCGDGTGLADGTGIGIVIFGNQGILKGNTVAQGGGAVGAAIVGDGGQVVANKVISFGHVDATITGNLLLAGLITSQTGTGGNIVTGNTVENVGPPPGQGVFGVWMGGDARPTLATNKLINAGGIVVQCTGCTTGGLVKANTVTGSPHTNPGMVVFTDAAGLTVQLNKLAYTRTGIRVAGNTGLAQGSGITVLQNTVTETMYSIGDCFEVKGSGHTLTGNVVKDCGGSGFSIFGDDLLLSGNSVSGARDSGFSIDGYNGGGTPHFGVSLEGNKATGAFQGFAIFDSNAAHGPDQPTSVTLTGNIGSLERQDFCHEDAGSYTGNTFTTTATTCDFRH